MNILEAIINDYIQTAEPIGSRTIAKKYDFGISSATIRNEMSDLEDMGLIIQPHASAGRIPSDKGYRLYVDRLNQYRELTKEESVYLQQIVRNNIDEIDYLIKETAKVISILTNCTTIVSEPHMEKIVIKHIHLIPLDEEAIMLILLTDNKDVKNRKVTVGISLDYETLINLSIIFNKFLQGVSIEDITNEKLELLRKNLNQYEKIVTPIMVAIFSIIETEENKKIYTSGVKNILEFPEFSDLDKARSLVQTLEEKNVLVNLLGDSNDQIQIIIGGENSVEQMKDCSLIKTNYMLGDKACGTIGIIGPTRMDYLEVVSILNGIVKNINEVLSEG